MRRTFCSVLCLLSLLFVPSPAEASGFDYSRIGGERGHAASPTPFAVYYNPAALSGTRRVHIATDMTLALRSATYQRTAVTSPLTPDQPAAANLGTARLLNLLVGPSLAVSLKLGNFALAVGVFWPMSGSASWKGNERFSGNTKYPQEVLAGISGARDGVARWHIIQGKQFIQYNAAGVSYLIPSLRLSFGASANLIYSRVQLVRARTGANDDNLAAEGRIDLDVKGIAPSFAAGVMWEPVPDRLWLGASYQAPPGLYNGMSLSGKVRTYITGDRTQRVELEESLPDIVRLALRHKGERYELRAFGDYTRWSALKRQCVVLKGATCALNHDGSAKVADSVIANQPRNWNDSVGVRLGASYWFSPYWEGFLGGGYESSAIPDGYLAPDFIDGTRLSGTLGGRLLMGHRKAVGRVLFRRKRTAVAFSYTHIHMLNRTVDTSRLDQFAGESRVPTAAGRYTQWFGMLNAFLEIWID